MYEGLVDKRAYLNTIGCLLQDPTLLDDLDRPIEREDFNTESFYELLFVAIYNLHMQGCTSIDEFSIDSYLSTYKKQYTVFQENRGIEYLSNAREMSSLENYDYYYHRLRKYSLLRYYEKQGLDTRFIFDGSTADVSKIESEQVKFDNYTEQDIVEKVESTFVINPNLKYCTNTLSTDVQAGDGMTELVNELMEVPDVGMALNNEGLNTVARGARLGCLFMRSCVQGGGKAAPNDTVIPTPDGFRKIGDIKVGDYLFDRRGNPTKVLNVFPQPEKKQVYEMILEDGRVARCCEEHLWTYRCGNNTLVSPTKEMISLCYSGKNCDIPINESVNFPEKPQLPSELSPYEIGLEVGKAIAANMPSCFPDSFLFTKYSSGSITQRKQILQGIMEYFSLFPSNRFKWTRGNENDDFVERFRFCIYNNKYLKQFVCNLCRSLGILTKETSTEIIAEQRKEKWVKIIDIIPTNEYVDMTCFTVDNDENLFLMNDYIVTHNTRLAAGDACKIAVPYYYDTDQKKYVYTGNSEPTTIFTTEMPVDEIQTLLIAAISKVNEEHILYGTYEKGELERVNQAISYIASSPLYIVHIPDFSIEDIKNQIKKYNREFGVRYFFFDYIHTSLRLMAEVNGKSGVGLKEHQLLLVFATELKTIAQQLDVFIFTASQLNGEAQGALYKDQNLLSGSKALANKLDMGVISMAPTKAELKKIESVLHKKVNMPVPNMCHWVYKVRRGRLTRIIIWTKVDLGTMTEQCLFVTNYDFELINMDFTKIEQVEQRIKEHSVPMSKVPDEPVEIPEEEPEEVTNKGKWGEW